MKKISLRTVLALQALLILLCPAASAHIFPHHSEPAAGTRVAAPEQIRIWFDGDLEGAFSRITVKDSAGKQVDKADSRVDAADRKLLAVGLPRLGPGTYSVFWSVAARDGHRSQGDYQFSIP